MILPYLLKLLCLCSAAFFVVHLVSALAVKLATAGALRIGERISPARATRLLFLMRVFPAGFGIFVVAGVCVPSYLRLEPRTATSEEAGLIGLVLAALAVVLWAVSIVRGWKAVRGSQRYLRDCQRKGRALRLDGEGFPAWMVEEPATLFAIAGMMQPRLLISRQLVSLLSGEQLAAALRHERAHWLSHDNLKRLMLAVAPDLFPFLHGFEALERGWLKYTERAADDRAAGGDPGISLSLAAALVSVSRLGINRRPCVLAAPLVAEDDGLAARIERLVNPAPRAEAARSWMGCLAASAAVLLSGGVIALGMQPALLSKVHGFLEHLMQ